MWTIIYIAQKLEEAIKIKKLLEAEGILARNKKIANEENDECYFEILVPSKEISEAHSLIIDTEI